MKNEKGEYMGKDEETDVIRINNSTILHSLLVLLVLVMAFNQYQIMTLYNIEIETASNTQSTSDASASVASDTGASLTDIIPTGTPEIYGDEIEISYDDASANTPELADETIAKLAAYDRQLTLQEDDLDRYISIAGSISCEYCCGADSIIFSNGQAACGCAHSYAMRGLAKYLITYHGEEYTDEEILEELGKWKVLFFPGIHEQKAAALAEQGIELNYINLASNKYRGIEQGATGGSMVGGC